MFFGGGRGSQAAVLFCSVQVRSAGCGRWVLYVDRESGWLSGPQRGVQRLSVGGEGYRSSNWLGLGLRLGVTGAGIGMGTGIGNRVVVVVVALIMDSTLIQGEREGCKVSPPCI